MERFFELSVGFMAITDLSSRVIQASRSWSRIGWDPEVLTGTLLLDLVHPDERAAAEAQLADLAREARPTSFGLRLRQGDGTYLWVQGNAAVDVANERIYLTGADISDRKALEEQLLARIQLEELVASVAASLLRADLAGQEEVEDAIERGLGLIASALGADGAYFLRDARRTRDVVFVEWAADRPGHRNADRIPMSPEAQRWWSEQMAGGRPVIIEDVEALGPEAADTVQVLRRMGVQSIVLVPLQQHRHFTGFMGLVTKRSRRFSEDVAALLRVTGETFMGVLGQADATAALLDARRELEQRNADLERSNEDLERFAYAAAHDLKAPLTRIEMALAAAPGNGGGDADQLLDIARRGASRMRQLIEDLLTYASVGVGPRVSAPVELDDVLTEVLADLAPAIEAAGVEVRRSPLPVVAGERALLGQLLQNLVSNAVKFARRDAGPLLRVEGEADDGGATIRVIDNGIGIDPAKRSAVFGVFTRLQGDDRYPGSGIGLATCAKVVAHHGGRISMHDGVDGGTTVEVWLPREPPSC
jgi:PAS domain S-box-containing protein